MDNAGKAKLGALTLGGETSRYNEPDGGREQNAGTDERHWEPPSNHRPKLRQLNAEDVDAVFAEGKRAINSLRDVQVKK